MVKRTTLLRARRTAVLAVLLAAFLCRGARPAVASDGASSTGTSNVTSGTWGVVATQSTSSPPPETALALSASTTTPQYFQAVNVGSVALTAMSYSVTISSTAATTLTLTSCTLPWTQVGSGVCTGVQATVGTWALTALPPAGDVSSGAVVATTQVPTSPAGTLYLQATPGTVPLSGATFTVSTYVSSGPGSQLRAPAVTNS